MIITTKKIRRVALQLFGGDAWAQKYSVDLVPGRRYRWRGEEVVLAEIFVIPTFINKRYFWWWQKITPALEYSVAISRTPSVSNNFSVCSRLTLDKFVKGLGEYTQFETHLQKVVEEYPMTNPEEV